MVEVHSGVRPSEAELAANDNGARRPGQGGGGGGAAPPAPVAPAVLGLKLAPLDETLRKQLSLPADVHGAVVMGVDDSSDAGEKGLKRGDVIVRAGDRPVTTAADVSAVADAARKAGRSSVLVGVHRAGRTLFLPLKIAK
jgi:serine protease Do